MPLAAEARLERFPEHVALVYRDAPRYWLRVRIAPAFFFATLLLLVACSPSPSPDVATADASAPVEAARDISASVTFDANGVSSPVTFVVPPSTRSITVVVEGDSSRLHALAAFAMADGVEQVGLDLTASFASEMQRLYFTEQSGTMPGGLHQSIRLGTFTHVYPFAPDQKVASGPATLRVVRDGPGGTARVRVLSAVDDGARVLHLNLVRVSASANITAEATFLPEVRRIFAQAGIEIVIDQALPLRGTAFEQIVSFTEPQESPGSDSAALARIVGAKTTSAALDVMIVDRLPAGVAGLSLGVPGPPLGDSYYFGVIIGAASDAVLGRVIAHETAHFLGLQHVENRGVSGKVYEDPIPDTSKARPNLMEDGTELTAGQAFVLSRSPLLSTR